MESGESIRGHASVRSRYHCPRHKERILTLPTSLGTLLNHQFCNICLWCGSCKPKIRCWIASRCSGAIVALLLLSVLAACSGFSDQPSNDTESGLEPTAPPAATLEPITTNGAAAGLEPAARNGMYSDVPDMDIDPSKYYYATFKTEKGDMRVQLFADHAPLTVNNFVFLARDGFYDNTTFHRVLEDFMAQAGDPTGSGLGGPGYQFRDEIVPGVAFDRAGLLAMANSGPNTNGSQFFITFAETPWLNGNHTIFGEILEGMEVLNALTRRDPQQAPDSPGDLLITVEIEERETSTLPTPTPAPPTPTPFAPSAMGTGDLLTTERLLATLPLAERSNFYNTAPDMVIDVSKTYKARIATEKGEILLSLFDDEAPIAVNNFVLLAALGFYDGTPVNDISAGELVILGAPENTPTSFVGYLLDGEIGIERVWESGAIGYLPTLNPGTGQMQSNGSQVLIVLVELPAAAALQTSFFGQVTEGLDILNDLSVTDTIETITIEVSEP